MSRIKFSRRRFLGQANCAALGSTSMLSALLNLRMTGSVAAAENDQSDYKALVCVFLAGGNDSFNMLTPIDSGLGYLEYQNARGELSLPATDFEPIGGPLPAPDGRQLGLHKAMSGLKGLYDADQLAFVNNVGTLIEQVSKSEVESLSSKLPLGLFSHSDQQMHWQSGLPGNRSPKSGWGGRMADLVNDLNGSSQVSMNVSLSGLNIFQSGQDTTILSTNPSGAPTIRNWNLGSFEPVRRAAESILDAEYADAYQRSFASSKKQAIEVAAEYGSALEAGPDLQAPFSSDNSLSQQLRAVARTIASRDILQKKRQTFFVQLGGFDLHGGQDDHAGLLKLVNDAVVEFQAAMVELEVADQVTLFSASDFGRTLTPNGNGTDHAWGGNQFVVGGAVNGGRFYGQYPSLDLGNELDLGRGRFIPTTSVDQYASELALWMGVSPSNLGLIFPNLANFHDTADGPALGYMRHG